MALLDTTTEKTALEEASQDARGLHARAVKARALSGLKVLTLRTAVSVGLRVVSSLCLAHLLFPKDYGTFAAAAYLSGLGLFLSDVGLGGALIRQAETPSEDETFTVFCAQQGITGAVVAALILGAPALLALYGLPPAAAPLLDSMALGLFLSSLRVVPMMALERDLQFPAIARCEVWENLAQTGGTIGLAALGAGPWALAGGGLLRGVVGLGCVWAASPWRPRGVFCPAVVRRLARFGLAFQLNALAPALLGNWMPLVVGRVLGVAAIGLVGWASNIASVPLMLSGVLNRVAFPAYSRLQSNPEALAGYLCASVRRLNAALCLLGPLFVIVCPVLIPAVFGRRWSPAVPLVQWLSLECVLLTLTGLLASVQNARGRAAERLAVTLAAGTLRWGGGYAAVIFWGLAGVGPLVFGVSFLEMCLSVFLVGGRLPAPQRLSQALFSPLITLGAGLSFSLWAGERAFAAGPAQTALSLALFLTAALVGETLTGGQMWREVRPLLARLCPLSRGRK